MRAWVRGSLCSTVCCLLAVPSAWAAGAAPHQLWVAHVMAGLVAGLVAFVMARSWPMAGIALVAAAWYAFTQTAAPAVPPDLLARFGERYPFHLQASALFVPLMVLAGIGARRQLMRQGQA